MYIVLHKVIFGLIFVNIVLQAGSCKLQLITELRFSFVLEYLFLFIYHFSHFRVTCTLFMWTFARLILWCRGMVFNNTFNNISVISWRLIVQEIRWNWDRMKIYMINVILYGRNCISFSEIKCFIFFYFEPNLSTTLHIPLFYEGGINVNKAN